jgi:hypothetical protein
MYINNFQIKIKYKFKLYDYIICDEQNILYQLQHFSNATKRTYALRILTYNEQRKAYRYKGSWIKKENLQKLKYKPS